ncbi:disintegrin and metalloproteinase domain-containing protein 10-like [Centruroides sculpturatus]|uniref:disintegrin and metalloproteinase domain-containing protein 10-like n=1 Tax=Centruroides sculpturatus TaxID=218467 RepID=UPI000C6CCB01|nr:disintegrin and metalloproteinase domain-containing protein 10-like [Centruroides sculpturatus]
MAGFTKLFVMFCCLVYFECSLGICRSSNIRGVYQYVSFVDSLTDIEYSSTRPNVGSSFRFGNVFKIQFEAFNVSFRILATKTYDLPINEDAKITIYDRSRSRSIPWKEMRNVIFYEGILVDRMDSKVSGYRRKGIFQSIVHIGDETYNVEPLSDYIKDCSLYNAIVFRKMWRNGSVAMDGNSRNEGGYLYRPIKIQANSKDNRWANKVCMIEIVSDHTFYKALGSNEADVIAEMLFVVREANEILQQVDFNGDGILDNVGLRIEEISVYKNKDDINYTTGAAVTDPKKYMSDLTRRVQDHCLSYTFTHIDFERSVVGQAFTASANPSAPPGGICEKPREMYGRLFSYNVGFVTSLNNGSQMSRMVFVETFTHEIGHSFGSHHDREEENECAPGFEEGNFIMAVTSNDGTKPNHRKFSPCSIAQISSILAKRGDSCLLIYNLSLCGNGITERGEECDCGTFLTCNRIDPCCAPRDGYESDDECTIRRSSGYVCSPRESSCCTPDCRVDTDTNRTCGTTLRECEDRRHCDGNSQRCPSAIPKPDGTPCQTDSRVCSGGSCNQSVCLFFGLMTCQCEEEDKLCDVCCKRGNSPKCRPAIDFGILTNEGKAYRKHPGEYCMGTHAVCNKDHQCVESYEEDRTLIDVLKPTSTIPFYGLIVDYWFYFFLLVPIIIVLWYALKADAYSKSELVRNFRSRITEIEEQLRKEQNEEKLEEVARVSVLFPTVPASIIRTLFTESNPEHDAIVHLLRGGHPMRTIFRSK